MKQKGLKTEILELIKSGKCGSKRKLKDTLDFNPRSIDRALLYLKDKKLINFDSEGPKVGKQSVSMKAELTTEGLKALKLISEQKSNLRTVLSQLRKEAV